MLEIDCSFGEGGGQLVRSEIALAAVTGTEIKLNKIRANRPKPGLAPQHITSIKAVGKLCNGSFTELRSGIEKLEFKPGKINPGKFNFDIGTAGSITLVLQASILPALFCKYKGEIELNVRGGTDVKWSPPFDYFKSVFISHLEHMGIKVEVLLLKRGYYPKGGGEVRLKIIPGDNYGALNLIERGNFSMISGVIHNRLLPAHIPRRILQAASAKLQDYSPVNINTDSGLNDHCLSPGTGLVLCAEFEHSVLGTSALGEHGLPAERVGEIAAERVLTEIGGHCAVDIYAADQLIPYLAILGGELTVREVSSHTKANMWLAEQFFEKRFRIEKQDYGVKISY